MGKLAKLFGNIVLLFDAIAEAFKREKGFLPVTEEPATFAPEELYSVFLGFTPSPASMPDLLSTIFPLLRSIGGSIIASALYYSTLYIFSLIISKGKF